MDDHEGNSFHVWFSRAGVVIRGLASDSAAAARGIDGDDVFMGLPAALASARNEPAFGGEEEATFAIWRETGAQAWSTGKRPRVKDPDFDGSASLLGILDAHPLSFIQYAQDQYGPKLPMKAVQRFYKRPRVRAAAIREVKADADPAPVIALARAMGLATEDSEAQAPKDLGAASTVVLPPPSGPVKLVDAEFRIVRDGVRTMLVHGFGGTAVAWVDDWDAFDRIRELVLAQLPERVKK
jgi:hypothetical protein